MMKSACLSGTRIHCFFLSLLVLLFVSVSPQAADQKSPRVLVLGSKSPIANPEGIAQQLKTLLAKDKGLGQTEAAWKDTKLGYGVTLMNFCYFPEGREARLAALKKDWTHVVLVDAPRCIYAPEFHFEGVRALKAALKGSSIQPLLLMLYVKGEKDLQRCGEIAYRVGKGCGVDVIPAGYAFAKAIEEGSAAEEQRDLAAALCIYGQITGKNPADLFHREEREGEAKKEADGQSEGKSKDMASGAWKVMESEKKREHFTGAYQGIVRVTKQEKEAVRYMNIGTSTENIWKGSMNHLLRNMKITPHVSSTPRSRGGFQMSVFPKVKAFLEADSYDILFARHYNLEAEKIKELRALAGAKNAQFQVFDRHWDMSKNSRDERKGVMLFVKNMEPALFRIYAHAKKENLYHIPFHVAIARMSVAKPDALFTKDGVHWTPWYGYMAANMSFTALTGKSGEMDLKFWEANRKGNQKEADYMLTAARIGHEVMIQLSTLSEK